MLLGNRRALSLFIIRSLSRNSVFVDRRMNVFCAINTSRKTHPWLTLCHKYIRTHTHSYFHSSHKYKHVQLHTNTALYLYIDLARIFVYMYISLCFTHILSKHYYSTSAYGYIQQMHKYSYAYGRCVCMREKLVRNDLFFVECAVNIPFDGNALIHTVASIRER